MKAVILAAGVGKRLLPITESFAKAMVLVKGKPVLQRIIETLKNCNISDIILVIGHFGEQIKAHFGDGSSFGVRIQYVWQKEQLGTGHAVLQAEPFLSSDDHEFLLVFGDNVVEKESVKKLLDNLLDNFLDNLPDKTLEVHPNSTSPQKSRQVGILSVVHVDDPRKYGVIEPDGNRIKSVVEKPQHPPSHWAVSGIHILPRKIFDALRCIEKSERGEYELPHAYRLLIADGFPFEWVDIGQFLDITTKEDLQRANEEYDQNRSR